MGFDGLLGIIFPFNSIMIITWLLDGFNHLHFSFIKRLAFFKVFQLGSWLLSISIWPGAFKYFFHPYFTLNQGLFTFWHPHHFLTFSKQLSLYHFQPSKESIWGFITIFSPISLLMDIWVFFRIFSIIRVLNSIGPKFGTWGIRFLATHLRIRGFKLNFLRAFGFSPKVILGICRELGV